MFKKIVLGIISLFMAFFAIDSSPIQVNAKAAYIEGSSVFQNIFDDSFEDGINVVWNTNNLCKTDTSVKCDGSSSWKVEVNAVTTYVEYYAEFPKAIDFRHGDKVGTTDSTFKKTASIEFDLYLDCDAGWWNFFLLEYRGAEFASKPVNQRYNRSYVTINKYADTTVKKEWQHVQIPVSAFSSTGSRANASGTAAETCTVDLTNIKGFGVCHMINSASPGYFYYDNMEILVNNMPDEYLGCNMVQPVDFQKMITSGDIKQTPIDISALTTTAFTGGVGKGWTGQGSSNELTGFDMFGEIDCNGLKFNVLDPSEHLTTTIGLGMVPENLNIPINSRGLYTKSVEIPINQKADGLYMIHNSSWNGAKKVALYTFKYSDGTTEACDIVQGREIFNWWQAEESEVCPIIWSGSNSEAASMGYGIKLNAFAFVNPNPTKEIKSLTCEIVSDIATDMIVAVTAVDCSGKGLYMPYQSSKYNPDTDNWYNYELANYSQYVGSALDVSYLLDPNVDENGYITTQGENFVNGKGEKVNFWGINVSGQSFFGTTKDEIKLLVDMIAAMGYNLVRLIDWDAGFYTPNIFGSTGGSSVVDSQSLDDLFYFVSCCKAKGIYTDFVMLGSRYGASLQSLGTFTSDEIADISNGFKFEVFIDERLQKATKDLCKEVFGTTNTYTGVSIAQDKDLAVFEVANESNLSDMYGVYTSSTYEFVSDSYKTMFKKQFNAWLLKIYGSNAALKSAWADTSSSDLTGLTRRENCEEGTVEINNSYLSNNYTPQRINDTFRFLYETQVNFYKTMYDWAIGDDGLDLNITVAGTTNLPTGDLNDLYINAAYDYVARHYYHSHPMTGTEFGVDTASGNVDSMVENFANNLFYSASKGDIIGKPYIVNESNVAEPNTHTAEYNIMTSAIYSLQNWNVCSFNLTVTSLANSTNIISNAFQFLNHPTRMGTASSAALLYYAQVIQQNKENYYTGLNMEDVMDSSSQNHSSTAGTYIIANVGNYFYEEDENGNVTYIGTDEETVGTNSAALLERLEHYYVTSDDGSILWSQDGQRFLVNTDVCQGTVGYYQNKDIELSNIEVNVDNEYSVVTVAGLGSKGASIDSANSLLLTAAGQCRNSGYELSQDGTTIKDLGEGPIQVEQITGEVTIKSYDDFEVYCLNTSGKRVKAATTSKTSEGFTKIQMKLGDEAMNYEIVRKNVSSKKLTTSFDDVYGEMIEKVEAVKEYLPSITDDLYMLGEDVTRGDYLVALVRALDLTTDNPRAYTDVSRYYYGYDDLKIARGLYLLDGTQVRAYDSLTKIDAYLAAYNTLGVLKYECSKDYTAISDDLKAILTDEEYEAIAGLIGSGFISKDDIEGLTTETTFTRGESVNLLLELKDYKNHGPVDPTPTPDPEPTPNQENNYLGLILGLSIGCPIGIAGVVAITIFAIKKKKTNVK